MSCKDLSNPSYSGIHSVIAVESGLQFSLSAVGACECAEPPSLCSDMFTAAEESVTHSRSPVPATPQKKRRLLPCTTYMNK